MKERKQPPVPFSVVISVMILLLIVIIGCDYVEYRKEKERQDADFTYIEWKQQILNEER